MSDFEQQLRERIERNERLVDQRARAEQEMDHAAEQVAEREAREARELQERRHARHAQLAERLAELVAKIRDLAPNVTVRAGWSDSGEEYRARFATIDTRPQRALSVDLDRDDDQVIVRWSSELGDGLELYYLLEFDAAMLEELVLEVIDDELWSSRSAPPPFPGNQD